jgi:hypothetical protein
MVFLGSYYGERFTEEHQYLNQVDLWREGNHVFGLTWDVAGLTGDRIPPTAGRFEGNLRLGGDSLILSNQFRGVLKGSVLTGAYDYEPEASFRLKKASNRIGANPTRAPLDGYRSWRAWADSVIDAAEASNPYLQQEAKKCADGDGQACLGIGNRLRDRKPEEARRYWEKACELDEWAGCKFLGDMTRYQAILERLCDASQKPSLNRNMACQELGGTAERVGKLDEAIKWYRLGCNEYPLPQTSCARLDTLQRQMERARGLPRR